MTAHGMTTDVACEIDDLYESEIIKMEGVLARMQSYIGTQMDVVAFEREFKERFAEIGFVVDVRKFQIEEQDGMGIPESERTWMFKIVISGRTEKQGEFDHEQMGHEVRSDIRGINQQGNVQKKQVGQVGFERKSSGLIVPK